MKLSKGVEWATHAAALLCALPQGRGLSAQALAEYHGIPAPYLAKQLQALSKAGIVLSTRGASGGYRLVKPPAEITLWDIIAAIEGSASAFRCTEIRQNGPCRQMPENCQQACPIAKAFLAAEKVYRTALSETSLADIAIGIVETTSPARLKGIMEWMENNSV